MSYGFLKGLIEIRSILGGLFDGRDAVLTMAKKLGCCLQPRNRAA